jgi:hypothetical protein
VKSECLAENSENWHKFSNGGPLPARPGAAAWTIVAALVLMVAVGFGSLRGQVNPSEGAGIVNPTHDAGCSDLRIAQLGQCQGQRPLERDDAPDSS